MKYFTKIENAIRNDDISGLKLGTSKKYTFEDIYFYEAKNITKAMLKYLSTKTDKRGGSNLLSPFSRGS